jgi:hypothetical protein
LLDVLQVLLQLPAALMSSNTHATHAAAAQQSKGLAGSKPNLTTYPVYKEILASTYSAC